MHRQGTFPSQTCVGGIDLYIVSMRRLLRAQCLSVVTDRRAVWKKRVDLLPVNSRRFHNVPLRIGKWMKIHMMEFSATNQTHQTYTKGLIA